MTTVKDWNKQVDAWDERRNLLIGKDKEATIEMCVEAFIAIANEAVKKRDGFFVALSGGSTPKSVFHSLASAANRERVAWNHTFVFWSDERSVPPDHVDSNYRMALEAGLSALPIPQKQIFRMPADKDVEKGALEYENSVRSTVPNLCFDLILLGMGSDGHTASLFPHTHGLHANEERIVIGNYVPQKETWRMSFTFPLINRARNTHIYVLGGNKAKTLENVLKGPFQPDLYPIQRVGTEANPSLWILDNEAAQDL